VNAVFVIVRLEDALVDVLAVVVELPVDVLAVAVELPVKHITAVGTVTP
jgi:hypothetical protein